MKNLVFCIFLKQLRFVQLQRKNYNKMEERTQKLLILVGEEGSQFEARDFAKLSEIIINYLSTPNELYEKNFKEILLKCIRRVPLKQHIYAALTAKIQTVNKQLSSQFVNQVVESLQEDLRNIRLYESVNSIIYLAELMNLSFLNSLSFFNIVDDLVTSIQSHKNQNGRLFLINVFSRSLPISAHSLNEKVYHDFKKILQKAKKQCFKNQMFNSIQQAHQRGNISDRSLISRIEFGQIHQIEQMQFNFKLEINIPEDLKFVQSQYSMPAIEEDQTLYQDFFKNQGIYHMYNIEMIIEMFHTNSATLIQKLVSYINGNKSGFMEKLAVETIIGKALKSKCTLIQSMILVKLMQSDHLFQSIIEETFMKIFHKQSDNYDFNALILFSDLISVVTNNWPSSSTNAEGQSTGWDWEKFMATEESSDQKFKKKKVLAKLIFQKMVLLNDRFKVPTSLMIYSPPEDPKSPTKYKQLEQMEVYEEFTELLKIKADSEQIISKISSEKDYEIFLQALFQRTCLSHTHLTTLMTRYQGVFQKNKQQNDWTLVTKIRTFWRKSLFHRILYLCFVIDENYLDYGSYVKYISKVKCEGQQEQLWIKLELNELNKKFKGRLIK